MAVLSTITCKDCGIRSSVAHRVSREPPEVCGACATKREDMKKAEHLGGLAALPVEERLRRIEEWVYHHKQNHPQAPFIIG